MTSPLVRTMAALAVAAAAAGLHAQTAAPQGVERTITVTGPGPHRLEADVDLVAGAARGVLGRLEGDLDGQQSRRPFADLRLVDADGVAVPYLLVPPGPQPAARVAAAQVTPIPATAAASGFEAAFPAPLPIAALDVSGIAGPYMKRVRVEGSVDREHWVELVGATTIFDLPLEHLRRTLVPVPRGDQRFVRVIGDDRHGAPLPLPPAHGVVAVLATDHAAQGTALTAPLRYEVLTRDAATVYRLQLPAARLPIVAVRLEAANPEVLRRATVRTPRLDLETPGETLGETTLRRVARGELTAGRLEVPISAPAGAVLELEVENGGNPPLDVQGIAAVFAHQPRIYFEARDGRPLVARYGRPDLSAPLYDLEAARGLIDVERAAVAAWGPPRPLDTLPSNEAPLPSSPVPVFGSRLDRGLFTFARPLPPGPAGVTRLALDAAVLAHSAAPGHTLHDLRIVDATGRQLPYLLERQPAPLEVPVVLGPPQQGTSATTTTYDVGLPFANLPPSNLAVTTTARVFTRRVALLVARPPDGRHRDAWMQTLATTAWAHADETVDAPPLRIALPSLAETRLVLEIDEGDNQPLPLHGATLGLPSYRVSFLRPADVALELVYGSARIGPPRYDVAHTLHSPTAAAADITPVPERALDGPPTASLVTPPTFWAVLGGATVVLLGLLARLMRATPARDTTDDRPGP